MKATRHSIRLPHSKPVNQVSGVTVRVANRDGADICPQWLDRIEHLDDVVFDALKGDANALDKTESLWHELRSEVPSHLLDESREQYIRRAELIFERYRDQPEETLGNAFAALEILTLMAD